jgi:nitrogen fixation/metabolism regulation signal transduction histidine kinase
MSQPLRELAEAATDIAAGDWDRQVPVRGSVEATTTADAFNAMTTSLRHWYEEAKKRDAIPAAPTRTKSRKPPIARRR